MRSNSISTPGSSARPVLSVGGLPPPPPALSPRTSSLGGSSHHHQHHHSGRSLSTSSVHGGASSSFSQSIAKSMTIEEMRQLHQRALSEAEAKRTELRLVLASRYRELVGSSDEVIRMKERAQELHDLVNALPSLMEKLTSTTTTGTTAAFKAEQETKEEISEEEKTESDEQREVLFLRHRLSSLPRVIHRSLDVNDVHQATTNLIQLFTLIASQTNVYPLANALASISQQNHPFPDLPDASSLNPSLMLQMRMIFLHVQTLPKKIIRIALRQLLRPASYGRHQKLKKQYDDDDDNFRDSKKHSLIMMMTDPALGAYQSAAALASFHLLQLPKNTTDPAAQLLDLYFDSKAKLLVQLLNKLTPPSTSQSAAGGGDDRPGTGDDAEAILSKIVLILQYDIILHPYQIFCLRKFRCPQRDDDEEGDDSSSSISATCLSIMSTLPLFDAAQVKTRCSKFLAAHLPLIRTKVKTVLVTIAGTTASALGKIRQSLYDKTDGVECMERLDDNGVCSWEEAVHGMVQISTVLNQIDTGGDVNQRRFSLWSFLFSNTFTSLVHSLLTTAFQSVHSQLVSTLQASLDNAPPLSKILPHEAYRNMLTIATELDKALLKVSEDAHELLVHAEEREESERRLRQSLYVQTCEIMGRLVNELRRMVHRENDDDAASDAVKELIVGRLCYLLKFRLTSLPTLLDPKSSPAALLSTSGMISIVDLQSAFELADDNEDGLITFEEAMEAFESAFSGTQFRGAEMLRETLLLSASDTDGTTITATRASTLGVSANVTLNELKLLAARGLRHEEAGPSSALGSVQQSLDDIVDGCFRKWAHAVMKDSTDTFETSFLDFLETGCTASDAEWQRLHPAENTISSFAQAPSNLLVLRNVSPYITAFMLDTSSTLNRTTCPSDFLPPVSTLEYAASLGITVTDDGSIPTFMDTVRWALLQHSVESVSSIVEKSMNVLSTKGLSLDTSDPSALLQYHTDVSFLMVCLFERNQSGFAAKGAASGYQSAKSILERTVETVELLLYNTCERALLDGLILSTGDKHKYVFQACDLFFSSLFGPDQAASVSAGGEVDLGAGSSSSVPLFREPLSSTRRFMLLPVQADRTLSEIQLRGKYEKKENISSRPELATSVVSSGLGFLSSMLKKS